MTEDLTSAFARDFTTTSGIPHPAMLGTRFDRAGNFLPEPGNTVVSHVVPGSTSERAIIQIRDQLQALDPGHHFAWTPVSSYHMTIFQGVIDSRRRLPFWPPELALDTLIADTTDYLAGRLLDFPAISPFAVKLDQITPEGLVVSGATDKDEAVLRSFRDELADRFGYRHPDHDSYVFHITLAYLIDWLPSDAHETYIPALSDITDGFIAEVPVIELGPADYCSFEDMNHFEPLLRLG